MKVTLRSAIEFIENPCFQAVPAPNMASQSPKASGDLAVECGQLLADSAAAVEGPMATILEGASACHVLTLLGEVKQTMSALGLSCGLGRGS